MAKNVKSTDSRKPAIVAALKKASGCTKVTNVEEIAPGRFRGSCMRKEGRGTGAFINHGVFEVAVLFETGDSVQVASGEEVILKAAKQLGVLEVVGVGDKKR